MSNIIRAIFNNVNDKEVFAKARYQYDYGMILRFEGAVTLPSAFEVHFALEKHGEAITQIGDPEGVPVPDALFLAGKTIYAWAYLHSGEDDGYTEYMVQIPVIKRAQPSDEVPTPVQQSAIDQAIAALGVAVEQTAADVETTTEKAAEAQASAEAAVASAAEASETAENVEENVTAARAAKSAAEAARDRAVQAETSANQSKTAAASSEANAAASATAASASAAAALTSEENANGAMMSAYSDANRADTAADTATSAKNDAVSAKNQAQSAKTSAETAATTATQKASAAATSADTATTKATAAANSATAAAGSATAAANSATEAATTAQGISEHLDQIDENTDAIDALKEDLSLPSKNLFGFTNASPTTANVSNVDFTYFQSSVKFNGTANANGAASWSFGGLARALGLTVGDWITLSWERVGGSFSVNNPYLSLHNVSDTTIRLDLGTSKSFQYTATMTNLQIFYANGTVFDNFEINLQIEKGNKATPFCRYGGSIADDKIARADIETINGTLTEYNARISQNENTPLVTDKYTDWVVGTLNSSGLPQNVTYRLRTVDYIPFSAVHKMTWDAGYIVIVAFYGQDFAFLGSSSSINNGLITKNELVNLYPDASYIKILFANSDVSTITVDAIATAHFKLYTINSQNNTYEDFVENDLPATWEVPYRDIMQMMGTGFSFAIQADTHYSKELPGFYNALKNLSRRIGFDFIANLGDIIRGYEYDTVADSYAEYEKAIKGLVDGSECSTFALMGNHDNGCMYATATGQISDAFLPAELYSLFGRPTTTNDPAVVWGSREGLFFYRDFDRVRVIVLNTSDLPYEEVSVSDISISNLKISTEQVEWLGQTALNTNKPVLVLSHAPLDGSVTIANRVYVTEVLEEFEEQGGIIIACVAGHTHTLDATKTNGINYIECDNGSDRCEVFAVDLENRTITTQQIGDDFTNSRTFTF